jgi:hypothetical protein
VLGGIPWHRAVSNDLLTRTITTLLIGLAPIASQPPSARV